MHVAVIGSGALARAVVWEALAGGFEVTAVRGARLEAAEDLRSTLEGADILINCHGRNPHRAPQPPRAHSYIGPTLAAARRAIEYGVDLDIPVLTVSTDCVLDPRGERRPAYGGTSVPHQAQPGDAYGFAMALREEIVLEAGGHVVRTSWVDPSQGLWAALQEAAVNGRPFEGWQRALWSGSIVTAVACGVMTVAVEIATGGLHEELIQLAAPAPVSKYAVARRIAEAFGYEDLVRPVDGPPVDRSMAPWPPSLELPQLSDLGDAAFQACVDRFEEPWSGLDGGRGRWLEAWARGAGRGDLL